MKQPRNDQPLLACGPSLAPKNARSKGVRRNTSPRFRAEAKGCDVNGTRLITSLAGSDPRHSRTRFSVATNASEIHPFQPVVARRLAGRLSLGLDRTKNVQGARMAFSQSLFRREGGFLSRAPVYENESGGRSLNLSPKQRFFASNFARGEPDQQAVLDALGPWS